MKYTSLAEDDPRRWRFRLERCANRIKRDSIHKLDILVEGPDIRNGNEMYRIFLDRGAEGKWSLYTNWEKASTAYLSLLRLRRDALGLKFIPK